MRNLFVCTAALAVALSQPALAGDAGDPAQSCDGSTAEMVDCLGAKTARWDKRMTIAYQEALKNAASPLQHDQLRTAQRLWIQYRDANCLSTTVWARARSRGLTRPNACAA